MSVYEDQDSRQQSCESLSTLKSNEEFKPETTTPKLAPERSKAAVHCGPELAPYGIHIACLCFTVTVVQLSFREVYWADEDGWKDNPWSLGLSQPVMAGLLQFVAKIHEIFILGSLSTIVIDIIRRRLLLSAGVPFGFLMGGYRFGSASSLFSGAFWGPFLDSVRHKKFGFLGLGLLIGIGTLYANAVGPASAVLIVPTLNWWPAYNLTVIMKGEGDIYPESLDPAMWMYYACLRANETLPDGCPAAGALDLQKAKYYMSPEDSANRTFTQRYGSARRELYTNTASDAPTNNSVIRTSSTIHTMVLEAMGLGGHFVTTLEHQDSLVYKVSRPQLETADSVNVMSPIVQTECTPKMLSEIRKGSNSLPFPTSLLSNSGNYSQFPVASDRQWGFELNRTHNFTWIDQSQLVFQGQESNATLGALATMAAFYNGSSEPSDVLYISCVMDARWAATEVRYDPRNSDLVSSNITDMSLFSGLTFKDDLRAQYGIGSPINITIEWADLLNLNMTERPNYPGEWVGSIVSYLYDLNLEDGLYNVTSEFAKFLSLTMADGLSQTASATETFLKMEWNSAHDDYYVSRLDGSGMSLQSKFRFEDTDAQVTFQVKRYGWGYGVYTKTARFAMVVVCLHAVLATAYTVFMVIHWYLYAWCSTCWRSIDQLFALAMVSNKPASLNGVSAGVGRWDTWKLDVAIREDQELHEHVELAFGGRDGEPVGREDGKVQWRKKYD